LPITAVPSHSRVTISVPIPGSKLYRVHSHFHGIPKEKRESRIPIADTDLYFTPYMTLIELSLTIMMHCVVQCTQISLLNNLECIVFCVYIKS